MLKKETKNKSCSLQFASYTLSSSSCSCFAKSRLIDAVLPLFPSQNSETGTGSLVYCFTIVVELDKESFSEIKNNVSPLNNIYRPRFYTAVAALTSVDTLKSCVQWLMRRLMYYGQTSFFCVVLYSLHIYSCPLAQIEMKHKPWGPEQAH